MKLAITVMTQFFPPETNAGARRLAPLVEALAQRHRVTVATPSPSYPNPGHFHGVRLPETTDSAFDVKRIGPFAPHSDSLVVRALRELLMTVRLAGTARRPSPDIVIASSPSMFIGPAGWLVARTTGAMFALDVRDMHWRLVSDLGVRKPRPPLRLVLRALERVMVGVARRADVVVGATPGISRLLLDDGVDPDRLLTLNNTISDSVLEDLKPNGDHPSRQARPTVTYVGLIGYSQGLEVLLDAATALPDVDFVIGGDGSLMASLEAETRRRKLANVAFPGYLDHGGVIELYRRSDILFVETRSSLYTDATVIPVKLFEYMAAGRPIVYGGRGLAVSILGEADCAVVIPPQMRLLWCLLSPISLQIRPSPMNWDGVAAPTSNHARRGSRLLSRLR